MLIILAAAVGLISRLALEGWLALGLGVGLVLWVGGAVSGQILLARLLDERGDVLDFLRQLLWIIPRFHVPALP